MWKKEGRIHRRTWLLYKQQAEYGDSITYVVVRTGEIRKKNVGY
jgi:hypothetical protein